MIQNKEIINFKNFNIGTKKLFLVLFSFLFFIPQFLVYATGPTNAGFIPGQIWYSSQDLIEGQTVNIHTAVWNGDKNPLYVKVEFYDKNVILGFREVAVNYLELKNVSIPWKITSGDHTISAKIVSASLDVSGKKEPVVLDRNITSNSKHFVKVAVLNSENNSASGADVIKNQIDKTSSNLNKLIPDNINTSFNNNFTTVDNFRIESATKLDDHKKLTQKEVNLMKDEVKTGEKIQIEDAIKKPIAYIKLILLSILTFIFNSKVVFYGLLILIVFYFLRFIYRKIRNR